MAVVDEKGRLFGKVNLLDLVVILAVLAVVGLFAVKHFQQPSAGAEGMQAVNVTFKLPSVSDATINAVQVGDRMWDSKTNVYLGMVVAKETKPARVVYTGPDGRLWETVSNDTFDFFVTISGQARVSEDGVVMGGNEMKVGRANTLKTPMWAGAGPTWAINTNP